MSDFLSSEHVDRIVALSTYPDTAHASPIALLPRVYIQTWFKEMVAKTPSPVRMPKSMFGACKDVWRTMKPESKRQVPPRWDASRGLSTDSAWLTPVLSRDMHRFVKIPTAHPGWTPTIYDTDKFEGELPLLRSMVMCFYHAVNDVAGQHSDLLLYQSSAYLKKVSSVATRMVKCMETAGVQICSDAEFLHFCDRGFVTSLGSDQDPKPVKVPLSLLNSCASSRTWAYVMDHSAGSTFAAGETEKIQKKAPTITIDELKRRKEEQLKRLDHLKRKRLGYQVTPSESSADEDEAVGLSVPRGMVEMNDGKCLGLAGLDLLVLDIPAGWDQYRNRSGLFIMEKSQLQCIAELSIVRRNSYLSGYMCQVLAPKLRMSYSHHMFMYEQMDRLIYRHGDKAYAFHKSFESRCDAAIMAKVDNMEITKIFRAHALASASEGFDAGDPCIQEFDEAAREMNEFLLSLRKHQIVDCKSYYRSHGFPAVDIGRGINKWCEHVGVAREVDPLVAWEGRGRHYRSISIRYWRNFGITPNVYLPAQLDELPGGPALRAFFTRDPNMLYSYALTVPDTTWATLIFADPTFDASMPINFYANQRDTATGMPLGSTLAGMIRPYPDKMVEMTVDEIVGQAFDEWFRVFPETRDMLHNQRGLWNACRQAVQDVLDLAPRGSHTWAYLQGPGGERLASESRRQLLRVLASEESPNEAAARIWAGRYSESECSGSAADKERELSEMARTFFVAFWTIKSAASATKRIVRQQVLKFYPQLRMLSDEVSLLKLRMQVTIDVPDGLYYSCIIEDVTKWAPTHGVANTDPVFQVLDEASGIRGFATSIHRALENCTLVAKTGLLDLENKLEHDILVGRAVSVINFACHRLGLTEKRDVFTSARFVKIGNVIIRMIKGPDGFMQEPWSIVYAGAIEDATKSTCVFTVVFIKGDDMYIITFHRTRHGIKVGQEYKRLYPGEVAKDNQAVREAIDAGLREWGYEPKPSQTTGTSDVGIFGKVTTEDTLQMAMPTKNEQRCLQSQNNGFPTVKATALSMVSSASAAVHKNVTPFAPQMICSYSLIDLLEQRRGYAPLPQCGLVIEPPLGMTRVDYYGILLAAGSALGWYPSFDLAKCFSCGDPDQPACAMFKLIRRARRCNHTLEAQVARYVRDQKPPCENPRYEVIASDPFALNFSDDSDTITEELKRIAHEGTKKIARQLEMRVAFEHTDADEARRFVAPFYKHVDRVYPRHIPAFYKASTNSAAETHASCFDNAQTLRATAAGIDCKHIKPKLATTDQTYIDQFKTMVTDIASSSLLDTPLGESSNTASHKARVRSFFPEVYRSESWEACQHRICACSVAPALEQFQLMPDGFIPPRDPDDYGYICVTMDKSKRAYAVGPGADEDHELYEVPGAHCPMLYHDRTENFVRGMFQTVSGDEAGIALRDLLECMTIEETRNPLYSQVARLIAETKTNGDLDEAVRFVRGVIGGTHEHRHATSFIKNRYYIGSCGNTSSFRVSSDLQHSFEEDNFTIPFAAGMIMGLCLVSLDVAHSGVIADNSRKALWVRYGGNDGCTRRVEELAVSGMIEFEKGLLSLPGLRLFYVPRDDLSLMLQNPHSGQMYKPTLAVDAPPASRMSYARVTGHLFFRKAVEHKSNVHVGEDVADDVDEKSTAKEVRAKDLRLANCGRTLCSIGDYMARHSIGSIVRNLSLLENVSGAILASACEFEAERFDEFAKLSSIPRLFRQLSQSKYFKSTSMRAGLSRVPTCTAIRDSVARRVLDIFVGPESVFREYKSSPSWGEKDSTAVYNQVNHYTVCMVRQILSSTPDVSTRTACFTSLSIARSIALREKSDTGRHKHVFCAELTSMSHSKSLPSIRCHPRDLDDLVYHTESSDRMLSIYSKEYRELYSGCEAEIQEEELKGERPFSPNMFARLDSLSPTFWDELSISCDDAPGAKPTSVRVPYYGNNLTSGVYVMHGVRTNEAGSAAVTKLLEIGGRLKWASKFGNPFDFNHSHAAQSVLASQDGAMGFAFALATHPQVAHVYARDFVALHEVLEHREVGYIGPAFINRPEAMKVVNRHSIATSHTDDTLVQSTEFVINMVRANNHKLWIITGDAEEKGPERVWKLMDLMKHALMIAEAVGSSSVVVVQKFFLETEDIGKMVAEMASNLFTTVRFVHPLAGTAAGPERYAILERMDKTRLLPAVQASWSVRGVKSYHTRYTINQASMKILRKGVDKVHQCSPPSVAFYRDIAALRTPIGSLGTAIHTAISRLSCGTLSVKDVKKSVVDCQSHMRSFCIAKLQQARDFRDETLLPVRVTQQIAGQHIDVRLDRNAAYYGDVMRAWQVIIAMVEKSSPTMEEYLNAIERFGSKDLQYESVAPHPVYHTRHMHLFTSSGHLARFVKSHSKDLSKLVAYLTKGSILFATNPESVILTVSDRKGNELWRRDWVKNGQDVRDAIEELRSRSGIVGSTLELFAGHGGITEGLLRSPFTVKSTFKSISIHDPDPRARHRGWVKREVEIDDYLGGVPELIIDPPWWQYSSLHGQGIEIILEAAFQSGTRRVIMTVGNQSSLDDWQPTGTIHSISTMVGDRFLDIHMYERGV